jgi:hypothetical protein
MEKIREIADYPLSDEDINFILEPDTNILTYPMLENVKHIDDILDSEGRAIILYLTENKNTGHWVGLLKQPNNTLEFFDPLGEKVDDQLKFIPKYRREKLNQDRPLLTNLLKNSGYKVIMNRYPLQKDISTIATCGRHVVARLLFQNLTLKQYIDMIKKSKVSPDEFVSQLTFPTLGK